MNLSLARKHFSDKSTIGELYIDGEKVCDTLEDTCRRKKVPGETAIPSGRYKILISMSERFKRRMPLLLNVPNFSGVRIHGGNTDKDTHGCILVGIYDPKYPDFISNSKKTFNDVFEQISRGKPPIWITITGGLPYVEKEV